MSSHGRATLLCFAALSFGAAWLARPPAAGPPAAVDTARPRPSVVRAAAAAPRMPVHVATPDAMVLATADRDDPFDAALAPFAEGRIDASAVPALRDLLRARADLTTLLGDRMARDDRLARAVLPALQAAGDQGCQRLLSAVATDLRRPFDLRVLAVIALGDVDAPESSTIDALGRLGQEPGELGATAVLALGRAAGSLRAAGADHYRHAAARIGQALAFATTPRETIVALKAIRSAGDPAFEPRVVPFLADPDAGVRAAAASAR